MFNKRIIAILLAVVLLLLVFGVFNPNKAHADTGVSASTSISKSIDAQAPALKVSPEQRTIGGGVVKPFYSWLPPQYCFWGGLTQSNYYCYRYGCTYFEKIAWGCYDGYVRMNIWYYA